MEIYELKIEQKVTAETQLVQFIKSASRNKAVIVIADEIKDSSYEWPSPGQ